jgi:hypothetical protein
MGMVHEVACPHGLPNWPDLLKQLSAQGVRAEMRMIDAQVALPDEMPPPDWQEVRVSLDGWMVTVRRARESVHLIAWGDPRPELQHAVSVLASVWTS